MVQCSAKGKVRALREDAYQTYLSHVAVGEHIVRVGREFKLERSRFVDFLGKLSAAEVENMRILSEARSFGQKFAKQADALALEKYRAAKFEIEIASLCQELKVANDSVSFLDASCDSFKGKLLVKANLVHRNFTWSCMMWLGVPVGDESYFAIPTLPFERPSYPTCSSVELYDYIDTIALADPSIPSVVKPTSSNCERGKRKDVVVRPAEHSSTGLDAQAHVERGPSMDAEA